VQLTREQKYDISYNRMFFAPAERPGWMQFYPADQEFPVTLAVPSKLQWGTYVFWEGDYRELTLDNDNLDIVCTFLDRVRIPMEQLLDAPLNKRGWQRPRWGSGRKSKSGYRIGGFEGKPECYVYNNGCHRVWFRSEGNCLWSFERSAEIEDATFRQILESVRFLRSDFFTQLRDAL